MTVVVGVAVLLASGDGGEVSPAATSGPVTIENDVDFSVRPVAGAFEVTEGADVLGCSSGTFVDAGSPSDGIERTYTCDSGSNEGSFTATFHFRADVSSVSDNGTWSVVEVSDDFDGLQGSGVWSIVYGPNRGMGTWTGNINYTS